MKRKFRIIAVLGFFMLSAGAFAEISVEIDKTTYTAGDMVRVSVRGVGLRELVLIRWVDGRGNVQKQYFVRKERETPIEAAIPLETPTTMFNSIVVRSGEVDYTREFRILMPAGQWIDYHPVLEIGDSMPKESVLKRVRRLGVRVALCRNRKLADRIVKNGFRLLYFYGVDSKSFYPKEQEYKALV